MYSIDLDKKIYRPLHKVLKDVNLSEEEALIDFSLLTALSKLSEFEDECSVFKERYGVSFKDFEKRVLKAGKENFREWDDYMGWKFANIGGEHWSKRVKELKDALQSS